jgi:hypothetical protein
VTEKLRGLWQVNQALLGFIQAHQPATSATLEMDETLIKTHKRDALHCHKVSLRPTRPHLPWEKIPMVDRR